VVETAGVGLKQLVDGQNGWSVVETGGGTSKQVVGGWDGNSLEK